MEKCLICNMEFNTISSHIRKHNITILEYKRKFNLIPKCKTCGKELGKGNKTGFCDKHRDRTGENNSFFGKVHSKETINKLKEKCCISSKEKWKDPEYRNKVITNSSKPRSEQAKINISNAVKNWYKNNPNENQKRKLYMKRYWKDGNIISNNFSCNRSKMEDNLYNELKNIYPTILKNKTIKDTNNKWYFPDILFNECKLIIEFYGDYWHANPSVYKENDILKHKIIAKEIWENDKNRIYNLENNIPNIKYKVLIVWESDFIKNKDLILQNLQKYINDRLHTMET